MGGRARLQTASFAPQVGSDDTAVNDAYAPQRKFTRMPPE